MKKVIFIDWNKTLSYSLFWEQLQNPNHKYNKYLKPIEKWLFVDNREIINSWMRGVINAKDVAKRISKDTNIPEEIILNELKISCQKMKLCSTKITNLISKIQKKNIKVVIATDNMDVFDQYTIPAMNLHSIFDGVINSSNIGFLKDDPEPKDSILFFDDYLKKYNLKYEDSVLLDDSPDKTGKYKKLGFDRILIKTPKELLEELNNYGKL